jgi:ParB family chromosome partitioning protein
MSTSANARPRLGRGLSSLISSSHLPVQAEAPAAFEATLESPPSIGGSPAPVAVANDGQPFHVSVELVRPNPHQPRKIVNEASIAELAASIKSSGVIQPIIVRRMEGFFELIAGERRWQAAKLAGLQEVPAIVRDVDSPTQAQMALIENIQREDLNPIDRAQAYRVLLDKLGLTQAELAGRMGEDRSSIANYLRLLDLSEPVRDAVRDGRLSLGHAKLLAGVDDILQQQLLAQTAITQCLSVRNLERLLQTRLEESPVRKPTGSVAHISDLEKSLTRQLGMRVQVRSGGKGRGRLVIHYASLDQFDDLLEKLGAHAE